MRGKIEPLRLGLQPKAALSNGTPKLLPNRPLRRFFLVRYNTTMTAPIFSRAKASAIRQLRLWPLGKGSPLTLNQVTGGGEYIPGGGESAPTVTSSLGSGIRTNYQLKDIDGTLVQASDVRLIVCPVLQDGVTDMPVPQTGDTITFGGTTYNVVSCKPWDFDGVTQIGFVVQGRI